MSSIPGSTSSEMVDKQRHWDAVYVKKALTEVSWYEPRPEKSLAIIRGSGVQLNEPIIDVGGGASFLVDALLAEGYRDLTVLDISAAVLDKLRDRLGASNAQAALVHADVTAFEPKRSYALWHDRAVFHFLVQPQDRARYVRALRLALRPGGQLVIATFGPSGPESCSGLPTQRYDQQTLAAELGPDFALVECTLPIHHTPWNKPQQFLYCRFVRKA